MPKTALVTGASSGMGEEIARTLHKLGYTVYAAARRTERLEQLATIGIHALTMDITDNESMTSGIEKIITETGHIDVLINNAGYGSYGAIEDIPMDEARHQFEVNVFGLARLIQLVSPATCAPNDLAPSSTSPPWVADSPIRWVAGITPANTPLRR